MRKIPDKIKRQLELEPDVCARQGDSPCGGRITWEHAIIFAGRQLNEQWAIIKLCERHHAVNTYQDCGELNKERNIHIALNRATDEELKAVSKSTDYIALRGRLNKKYKKLPQPSPYMTPEMVSVNKKEKKIDKDIMETTLMLANVVRKRFGGNEQKINIKNKKTNEVILVTFKKIK